MVLMVRDFDTGIRVSFCHFVCMNELKDSER